MLCELSLLYNTCLLVLFLSTYFTVIYFLKKNRSGIPVQPLVSAKVQTAWSPNWFSFLVLLQDPENPTVILCDSKLKELFGCESLTAHGVSELVSDHLFKQPAKI
jgi:hypothetical protein